MGRRGHRQGTCQDGIKRCAGCTCIVCTACPSREAGGKTAQARAQDRAGQSSIHLPGQQQQGWVRRRLQPSGWAPVQHWGLVLCPGWGWAGWWGQQQVRPLKVQLPGHRLDGGVHWALRWVLWLYP